MPILHRRTQVLPPRSSDCPRSSSESTNTMSEQVLLVGHEYENPPKGLDLLATPKHVALFPNSKSQLRIQTYSKTDLHDRYLSDEEEPSPSPGDSASEAGCEADTFPADQFDEGLDYATLFECEAEIAVAVPLMAVGRPILVDITNHAPLHKRKRVSYPKESYVVSPSTSNHRPIVNDENDSPGTRRLTESTRPLEQKNATRKVSTAPVDWLQTDELQEQFEEEDLSARLTLWSPSTYVEHDPYNLEPPRLRSSPPRKRITRRHHYPPPSMKNSSTWRGLTRSLSMAKRQGSPYAPPRGTRTVEAMPKTSKEVEPMMIIPPFSFETQTSV